MITLQDIKNLSFKDYKSYKKEADIYIPEISDFNVIIGKNNTGKTSFIDIIDYLLHPQDFVRTHKVYPNVSFGVPITKDQIVNGVINNNTVDRDFYNALKQHVGQYLYLNFNGLSRNIAIEITEETRKNWDQVLKSYEEALHSYKLFRISAERDIRPEAENKTLFLTENGEGASNLVRGFINQVEYNEHIIEDELLKHLNKIMVNDASFTRIQIQQNYDLQPPSWEIFLEEKDAGRFALSKSGSGLKTIILVLLNLLVIPFLPENNGKNLIYAFEELENNLHPALQRRLFDYLYNFAVGKNIPVFLTTHSHVAIDMFASKPGAQVLHVTKENHESKIKKVESFFDKKAILDDLAVKASDLFQANGIIWVEGPSDRIYINKWLEVFCNSKYQEGRDFQYLYYGGRLLSHYCLDDDKELMQQHSK